MTDMMMNEMTLTDDTLSSVNAGTVSEYADLCAALPGTEGSKKLAKFSAHLPGGNCIGAGGSNYMVGILRDLGIEADISLGFLGTGAFSSPNKYTSIETGERLSHAQVLEIMKRKFG